MLWLRAKKQAMASPPNGSRSMAWSSAVEGQCCTWPVPSTLYTTARLDRAQCMQKAMDQSCLCPIVVEPYWPIIAPVPHRGVRGGRQQKLWTGSGNLIMKKRGIVIRPTRPFLRCHQASTSLRTTWRQRPRWSRRLTPKNLWWHIMTSQWSVLTMCTRAFTILSANFHLLPTATTSVRRRWLTTIQRWIKMLPSKDTSSEKNYLCRMQMRQDFDKL